MGFTISNFKVIFSVFTLLTLGIALISCSPSEYVCIKVKKPNFMSDSSVLSRGRDSLIVGGFKIGKMAQRYYNKPVSMGGGGDSFTDFNFCIPPYLRKTEFGTYTAFVQHPAVLVLVCTGKQMGQYSTNPVQVTLTVTPENILVAIND